MGSSSVTSKPALFSQSAPVTSPTSSAPAARSLGSIFGGASRTQAAPSTHAAPAAPTTTPTHSNANITPPSSSTASASEFHVTSHAPAAPQSFVASTPVVSTMQTAPVTAQSPSRVTGFGGFATTPQASTQQYTAPQSYGNAALQMEPVEVPVMPPVRQVALAPQPTFTEDTGLVPAQEAAWANLRPISSHAAAPAPAPQPEPPSFLFTETEAPQTQAVPAAKKKGPSLFERVTGMASASARRAAEPSTLTPVAQQAPRTPEPQAGLVGLNLGNAPAAPQTMAPAPASEPQLLSQQGSKLSSSDEDLLNIPAFLRRQAN